ncbi:hypothetical protein [Leisingera sp. JC11]|uniref:hypothetical protein n=1 Tax=Leisingera sp. JC11 TaxID=3042469 RepID=UPI003452C0CF
MPDLENLVASEVFQGLNKVQQAEVIIWAKTMQGISCVTISDLSSSFVDIGLHRPNTTRLRDGLRKSRNVLTVKRDAYAPSKVFEQDCLKKFSGFLTRKKPEIEEAILPDDFLAEEPKLLQSLGRQVNATYQFECYDSTSVMMRRLMEALIIRAFNKNGARAEILDGKEYLPLEKLIDASDKTTSFKLSRGVRKAMLRIKLLGDKGAHSPTYSVRKQDVDELSTDYRATIADLLST